jgi:hypothetical protein
MISSNLYWANMVKKCMLILHFFCMYLPSGKMVDQMGLTSLNFGLNFDLFYDFHVRFDDILELKTGSVKNVTAGN